MNARQTRFGVLLLCSLFLFSCSFNPGTPVSSGVSEWNGPVETSALSLTNLRLSFNTASIAAEITVSDLFLFNSKLYSCHWDWGNTYSFNGSSWSKAATNKPYIGINPSAHKFAAYNDGTGTALFVLTLSGAYGGMSALFKLVGSSWNTVKGLPGAGLTGIVSNLMAYDMCVYQENLYISTRGSTYVSNIYSSVFRHKPGTGWSTTLNNPRVDVFSKMITYNDGTGEKLYVFGTTNNIPLYWVFNGTTWSSPKPIATYGYPYSAVVYNGKLFAGVGGSVYVLNGGSFVPVHRINRLPSTMCVWNGSLYVGYSSPGVLLYVHSGTVPSASWSLSLSLTNMNPAPISINSMAVYGTALYMGLQFARYRSSMITSTSAQIYKIQ